MSNDHTPYHPARPRLWTELAYAGQTQVPPHVEGAAGSWPTWFVHRNEEGTFVDGHGNPIAFEIRHPDTIDFEGEQLTEVKATLANLTPLKINMAEYWNAGPPTKQWTPIIDRLLDTYSISAPRAARILAAVHGAINDALVVAWYFKYRWLVARPNQLDPQLATITCTPYHPSYPAGHSTLSGCAQTVLTWFFGGEAARLEQLAEECSISRTYAGVHFPADCSEGLRLGRQIGRLATEVLTQQRDLDGELVDYPITQNLHAELPPPPYVQAIPYPRSRTCKSILDPRQAPGAR